MPPPTHSASHSRVTGYALLVLVVASCSFADTYATFVTTRFLSSDGRLFVEFRATADKSDDGVARLRKTGSSRPVWTRRVAQIPESIFVAKGGARVIFFEFYYGNQGDPGAAVVTFVDEKGRELKRYRLAELADIQRTPQTTSAAHWVRDVRLVDRETVLQVVTGILKNDPSECSKRQSTECYLQTIPNEVLRFDVQSGALTSRVPAVQVPTPEAADLSGAIVCSYRPPMLRICRLKKSR